MGLAYSGNWARSRQRTVPYAGAAVWGTGVHPVHAQRGPNGRVFDNRAPMPSDLDDRTKAATGGPGFVQGPDLGYDHRDLGGLDVFADQQVAVYGYAFDQDGLPDWSADDEKSALRTTNQRVPWNAFGMEKQALRARREGPQNGPYRGISSQIPTETVSEGWLNKAKDGIVPDAHPADDAQVFVQTSMVQRYKSQDNRRAVQRDTDDERTPIESRVTGMKTKHYSEGERDYDMFPRQHTVTPRPFWFRTMGLGPLGYQVNDQHQRNALQRTPPPDFSMGTPDTELSDGGYTTEDNQGWY